jgi:hypothetical protein
MIKDDSGKVIIFDVFIKNDILYAISTYYNKDEPSLNILINDQKPTEYGYNIYAPVRYFTIPAPSSSDIRISLNNKIFNVKADTIDEPTNEFAIATLFKDDSDRIDMFVKYYMKHGCNKFYLYYNGETLPDNLPKYDNVIYKLWDYKYFNDTRIVSWVHLAQMTFLTSVKYRYASYYKWFGLVDLDELILPPDNMQLLSYLNSIPTNNIGVRVRNHWANMANNIIQYTKNPTEWESRTKCIYRGTYPGFVCVHTCKGDSSALYNSNECKMLHIVDGNPVGPSMNKLQRLILSKINSDTISINELLGE